MADSWFIFEGAYSKIHWIFWEILSLFTVTIIARFKHLRYSFYVVVLSVYIIFIKSNHPNTIYSLTQLLTSINYWINKIKLRSMGWKAKVQETPLNPTLNWFVTTSLDYVTVFTIYFTDYITLSQEKLQYCNICTWLN